ncbi:MAG TPA: sensor domain-containing diguanylate cyclase, partial [Pyrinomonadaceae bacterium]|nr:sensor domain-containing diguanylate cyclase [Pyrinomonadaceae bacterium]
QYRRATDLAISGDWAGFPPNEFFGNVLIAGAGSKIDNAAKELSRFRARPAKNILDLDSGSKGQSEKVVAQISEEPSEQLTNLIEKFNAAPPPSAPAYAGTGDMRRSAEASALRTLYGRLAKLSYDDACRAALEFMVARFGTTSLVWLERKDNTFLPVAAMGSLLETPIKIGITADNQRFIDSSNRERAFELRERIVDGDKRPGRILNLFASVVGGEIRGAVGVEGDIDEPRSRDVALFCRRVGPQIEILRLRREISNREWLNRAVTRFNESLKRIDADDFWTHVTQVSAELIQSERASLLLRNDHAEGLVTKAAVGARTDLFTTSHIGERVSNLVLEDGHPIVVEDISRIGVEAAPAGWQYKTPSFLSYPILIGERRIGVLNFTDKATGNAFDERDLELLQAIGPQIAIAVDRTVLKDKAGEFEQLSVTDPLTGLLNRRYLEKRLIEEIQRSKRHRFPMSLMMLDVDEFKSYNDTFGHPAGDAALKIVASILQDMLRGDDVAARYGGEEFAILLPQTTSTEGAAIAERLRQRIEHTEFPKRKVTVSIGIAACSNEIDTPTDIVGAADHALYEAKNHGRNNVRIYDGFGKSLRENIH